MCPGAWSLPSWVRSGGVLLWEDWGRGLCCWQPWRSPCPPEHSVHLQLLTFLGPAGHVGLPFQQTLVQGPRGFSRLPCLTAPSTFGRFALSPVLCSSKDRVASLLPTVVVHLEGNRSHLRTRKSCLPSLSSSQWGILLSRIY